jgi:hypothetical protein
VAPEHAVDCAKKIVQVTKNYVRRKATTHYGVHSGLHRICSEPEIKNIIKELC